MQEMLISQFAYNSNTGIFTRKTSSGGKKQGTIAGTLRKDGYIEIRFNGKKELAHRLAWLYVNGKYPKQQLDHINHDRSDNSICNLRESDDCLNMKNKTRYRNNSSGVCGVNWYKPSNKWNAQIQIEGKKINLGYFIEFHEAVNARKNAEVLYGFHENHGNEFDDELLKAYYGGLNDSNK